MIFVKATSVLIFLLDVFIYLVILSLMKILCLFFKLSQNGGVCLCSEIQLIYPILINSCIYYGEYCRVDQCSDYSHKIINSIFEHVNQEEL
jgi:hypothetical protein